MGEKGQGRIGLGFSWTPTCQYGPAVAAVSSGDQGKRARAFLSATQDPYCPEAVSRGRVRIKFGIDLLAAVIYALMCFNSVNCIAGCEWIVFLMLVQKRFEILLYFWA